MKALGVILACMGVSWGWLEWSQGQGEELQAPRRTLLRGSRPAAHPLPAPAQMLEPPHTLLCPTCLGMASWPAITLASTYWAGEGR